MAAQVALLLVPTDFAQMSPSLRAAIVFASLFCMTAWCGTHSSHDGAAAIVGCHSQNLASLITSSSRVQMGLPLEDLVRLMRRQNCGIGRWLLYTMIVSSPHSPRLSDLKGDTLGIAESGSGLSRADLVRDALSHDNCQGHLGR